MAYNTSDPISSLTFLTPIEVEQVSKLASTLGGLRNVSEFQWGEADLSAASLDKLTHAIANLKDPLALSKASIEMTPMGPTIEEIHNDLKTFDAMPNAPAEPVYTGYQPPKFHKPDISVPEVLEPSLACLLGVLLLIPFLIPAAVLTPYQAEYAALAFEELECNVIGSQWVPTKGGGYWTYEISIPGETYIFWDRLSSVTQWQPQANGFFGVKCWYGSDGTIQSGQVVNPKIKSVRVTESAWVLWSWSLVPVFATLVACGVLCTCKKRKLTDYDCDTITGTGCPIWGVYLVWGTLIASGVTCFWFASGCSTLEQYANANDIPILTSLPYRYYYYYGNYYYGGGGANNGYYSGQGNAPSPPPAPASSTTGILGQQGSGAGSDNFRVYSVCGAGGIAGGTTGLWVVGGIFVAVGVGGGAASLKCFTSSY